MITVRFSGGLGNQMFQYAAGKALAERCGVPLSFDLQHFSKHLSRPFLLDRLAVPEARSPTILQTLRRRIRPSLDEAFEYREPHFHYDPAFEALTASRTLLGLFQSERYFDAIGENLRDWFAPAQELAAGAAQMLRRIKASRRPVSVHIRRGDYVLPDKVRYHGFLGFDYYRTAVDRIENMIGSDSELFVFSDDPDAAEQLLDFVPKPRLVPVRGDLERPWEDIALMASCHHHIIANSSFSWWGAWLNRSADKSVIAPRAWFNRTVLETIDTSDLYPPAWIRV